MMIDHRPIACIQERRELPPFVFEVHDPDCPCIPCDQARVDHALDDAARAAAEPETPVLDAFCHAGWLAGAGLAIGSAIAFAIDPHGAAHALVAAFTWSA